MTPPLPRTMVLSLGLFSGASLSACWIVGNPHDYIGSVALGTAACAAILIALRFEVRKPRRNRRRGDGDPGPEAAA
jgi:hypothetical protein